MSDYSSDDDNRRVDSWRKTKGRRAKRQSNFLETILDSSIASSMEKPLFKAIRMWIHSNTGLDLKFLVWAIALCVPTHKYGSAICKWLSSNLTNSVELDYQDALVTDLLIWISKQPSNQLFAWLPSFEHLEWKDLSNETKTADTDESNTTSSSLLQATLLSSMEVCPSCYTNRTPGTMKKSLRYVVCGGVESLSKPCYEMFAKPLTPR